MKLYGMETASKSLYLNLNYFPFFRFMHILLYFKILHDGDGNLNLFLLMVGYNLQFQMTLSMAVSIRYLLLSPQIRIDEVAYFLQTILQGVDRHRIVRLAQHFERLWMY